MKPLILIIACIISMASFAQDRKHEIGIRGGESSGIFYRGFIDEGHAIKGLMSFRNNGMQLTALYEKYDPVFCKKTSGFFLYYGVGGHFGYTRWNKRYHHPGQPDTYYYDYVASPVFGIDGIIGLEYRIESIPLSLAFDYKPFLEVLGEHFFDVHFGDFGFSLKVRF